MPQVILSKPPVQDSLSRRLTVDMKQHRITFGRIKVERLHHPTIELNSGANVDSKEFGRPALELVHSVKKLCVIDNRPHARMHGESHQICSRRLAERGIGMKSE